jgi:hypothetical protein
MATSDSSKAKTTPETHTSQEDLITSIISNLTRSTHRAQPGMIYLSNISIIKNLPHHVIARNLIRHISPNTL